MFTTGNESQFLERYIGFQIGESQFFTSKQVETSSSQRMKQNEIREIR